MLWRIFCSPYLHTLLRMVGLCGENLDLTSASSLDFSKGCYLKYLASSTMQAPTNEDICYCRQKGAGCEQPVW